MKKKQTYIVYLISITLLITIGVQTYWNYRNYLQNKQQVINEVQNSLNNAVEEYYAEKSKNEYFTIVTSWTKTSDSHVKEAVEIAFDKLTKKTATNATKININKIKTDKKQPTTSTKKKIESYYKEKGKNTNYQIYQGKVKADSISLQKKINAIYISIKTDTIEFSKLDSLFLQQINKRNLSLQYNLKYWKKDSVTYESCSNFTEKDTLITTANSTFIKKENRLQVVFQNPVYQILKRSIWGILLSFSLAIFIIFSLFYLLYIIRSQKQLDNIKNDLISNITHEFKTPIATATTAIEALTKFKAIDDKEKALNYLNISELQLKKLYQMVEKLLETATLDSSKLQLKKEPIDIVELLKKMAQKFQLISYKEIIFESTEATAILHIDNFHFENAIANIIDNAIKYGGDTIKICINQKNEKIQISISDNGKGIAKAHRERIFNKFYRIPQGNTHNVKGFGIGLYYTKQIIEKHNGTIQLIVDKATIFQITIPLTTN